MKSYTSFIVGLLAMLLLSGCNILGTNNSSYFRDEPDIIRVDVIGYGAPKNTYTSAAQRRLMTMRASEVDAYRKIAEQVSGVFITGDSTLNDFMAGNDTLRAQINTFIQGASIVSQEILNDGVAVTQMSMIVSRNQLIEMLERGRNAPQSGPNLVPGGVVRPQALTF